MFKCCKSQKEESAGDAEVSTSLNDQQNSGNVSTVILDLSNVEFIDEAAFKVVEKCVQDYKLDGIRLVFTNCHGIFLIHYETFNLSMFRDIIVI